MSLTAVKRNRRLNLLIPCSLVQQLKAELEFLGLETRTVVIEERSIQTRNDFIRLIVSQYVLRYFEGEIQPVALDEETEPLQYYLDRHSEGLWDTAIADNVAKSFNELATQALYDYFHRQESLASAIATQAAFYQQMLKDIDVKEWRKLVA